MYDAIFVGLFVAGWLLCAYLPWLLLSLWTRGGAGLGYLPLCLFAGFVAGLAVPLAGLDDADGLWLSFLVAFLVPAGLLAIGRVAHVPARNRERTVASVEPEIETRRPESL